MTVLPVLARTSDPSCAKLLISASASGPIPEQSQAFRTPFVHDSPTKIKVMLAASHIIHLLPTDVTMLTVGLASAPRGIWTKTEDGT